MTLQEISNKGYEMYVSLRKSGFEEPQALSLVSNYISNLSMQTYLTQKADIQNIVRD